MYLIALFFTTQHTICFLFKFQYDETASNAVKSARTMGRTLLRTLAPSKSSHWMPIARNGTIQVFVANSKIVSSLALNNSMTDTSMRVVLSEDIKKYHGIDIGVVVSSYIDFRIFLFIMLSLVDLLQSHGFVLVAQTDTSANRRYGFSDLR